MLRKDRDLNRIAQEKILSFRKNMMFGRNFCTFVVWIWKFRRKILYLQKMIFNLKFYI